MAQPPDRAQEKAAGVDPAELRVWMERYGPGLRRYFARRVPPAEAEELVQDVFLAMHARSAAEPIDNVQGYLFRIAANLLSKRHEAGGHTGLDEAPDIAEGFSPERILIGRQEASRVLIAIRNLPPRTREAFALHRFEDMTYEAIARRLGISVSAVSKLVARALAHVTVELRRAP
ncbi:MAG: RNA polymerase sigma factor [Parcubacteria group bacterium]